MSLFRKLIDSKNIPKHRKAIPVMSPLSGRVKPLDSTPLVIFTQRLLGEGIALEPSGSQIFAPFDCKIDTLPITGDQIVLRSTQGLKLLIQVGIGTHLLMGEGIKLHAKEGAILRAGDKILEFNLSKLKAKTESILCPITLLNSDKILGIEPHYHQALALEDKLFTIYI